MIKNHNWLLCLRSHPIVYCEFISFFVAKSSPRLVCYSLDAINDFCFFCDGIHTISGRFRQSTDTPPLSALTSSYRITRWNWWTFDYVTCKIMRYDDCDEDDEQMNRIAFCPQPRPTLYSSGLANLREYYYHSRFYQMMSEKYIIRHIRDSNFGHSLELQTDYFNKYS